MNEGELLEAFLFAYDRILYLEAKLAGKPIEEFVKESEDPSFRKFVMVRNIIVTRHNALIETTPQGEEGRLPMEEEDGQTE